MAEDLASSSAGLPQAGTTLAPTEYIEQRLEQYRSWYDGKAIKTKALHLRLRTLAVVGAAVVPVLVNIDLPYVEIATTLISLMVVILVSLESVYHYREQWKNYRSTEQALGHELFRYKTRTGVFEGLDDESAFKTLVERVENAIASENASTLSTMTLASQSSHQSLQ
ncbi:DUF4231 domain-containing protein [Nonomuraea glycinis]|uniref:DUF4231 domain-containing protein n=1 Tax=Nonomuraea glycinis TaxID=2047744 RepID=UPI002E13556D|nr:DUF4231 domain-containing protein [Nonomuraea glycinis]